MTNVIRFQDPAAFSAPHTYSAGARPQCSASGRYIAHIAGTKLCVRSTRSMAIKRIADLGAPFSKSVTILRWDRAQPVDGDDEERLLLVGGQEIRIFVINRSSAASNTTNNNTRQDEPDGVILSLGPIANATWISGSLPINDGHDYSFVVRIAVFSSDGLTGLQIWSSDGVELDIPGPKFPRLLGVNTNHAHETIFTLLSRPYTHDTLDTYSLRKQVNLSSYRPNRPEDSLPLRSLSLSGIVVDAKDVKVSPSSIYTAVLDSPAMGYSVHLFVNSQHLHSYNGPYYLTPPYEMNVIPAMSITWMRLPPSDDFNVNSEILLVGDEEEVVTLLPTTTFKPLATLNHAKGYVLSDIPVWVESISNSGQLVYTLANIPYSPLSTHNQERTKNISHITVSRNNNENTDVYVATVAASMPYTVWVWRINFESADLVTVLSHTLPIKNICFSQQSQKLLISISQSNFIGIWDASDVDNPGILQFSDLESSTEFRAFWVKSGQINIDPSIDTETKDSASERIYAYDGRDVVVFNGMTGDDDLVLDQDEDSNVLQMAADVAEDDQEQTSIVEDTFMD